MKALQYDTFGSAEVFHFADAPAPVAGAGEVVVGVVARSINLIDIRVRSGMMGPLVNRRFPKVPGADFAGTVLEVGRGVTDFKPGDRVFGAANPFVGGSFAEQLAVPVKQIAHMPDGLDLADAAALPIAGLAALVSIRDLGRVTGGSRILVHGATGPVGLAAVQIAKSLGAHVTAVAGAGLEAAMGLGADVGLDYRTAQPIPSASRFGVILNASGKMPFAVGRPYLAAKGVLIEPSPTIPIFIGSKLANLFRLQKHLVLAVQPRRQDLDQLAAMVSAGELKPIIAATYRFDDAVAAFGQVEAGGVVGKVVVTQ